MNDIEVSSIDLVEGGNVFKQGHYLTLGYVPRDEKGETVDLSGKTLNVALWGRKGVVFEAAATYSGGIIRFTLDKMVPAGDYTVEFTVTSSTDAKYRKKFPTNQHSGRIAIKQSADDLGVVGIQVYTVAQLKAEQKALLDAAVSGFTVDSETKMARVSDGTTYASLPARLEADKQETAAQLAEKVAKGQVSISDIDKNKGLFDQTYFSDEVKQQWTGNTPVNATPPNAGITRIKLAGNSVGIDTTDFMKVVSNNLIDKNTLIHDTAFSSTTGNPTTSVGTSLTPFMKIEGGSQYTLYRFVRIGFYDQSYNFISQIQGTEIEMVVTAPVNAVHARVSVGSSRIDIVQFNKGGTLLPRDEYRVKLINEELKKEGDIASDSINKEHLKKGIVSPVNTNFFEYSSNLYNAKGVKENTTVNTYTGVEEPHSSFSVSEFIETESGGVYTSKGFNKFVFYDINRAYVDYTVATSLVDGHTFTIPNNAKYMRGAVENFRVSTAQINKGSLLAEYEAFYVRIKNEHLQKGDSTTAVSYYTVPERLTGWYKAPAVEGYDATSGYTDTISLANIYDVYDSMVSNDPNYVTKTLLGNDATDTYPVYQYHFNPEEVETDQFTKQLPKIIIFTNQHGEEKGSTLGMRNFMRDVCENWRTNPILEYIRWNVQIITIPIVNPYGFVNHTRKNGRGVDINRNMDYMWEVSTSTDPGGSTYKGESPFSEKESQYIRDVVLANPDAMALFDYHMNGTSGNEYGTMFWHSLPPNQINGEEEINKIAKYNIKKLTNEAQKTFNFPADSGFVGYVSASSPGPKISHYGASTGIPSATIECTRKIVGEEIVYSAESLRLVTEFTGNSICTTIKEFSK